MSRKLRNWVIALLLVIAAAVVVGITWPAGPRYQGRTLRTWLKDLNSSTNPQAAEAAVQALRAMGTNALPALLAELRSLDAPLRSRLEEVVGSRKFLRLGLPSHEEFHLQAVAAFRILGPTAAPAIPELGLMLQQRETAPDAAQALVGIGPEGVAALLSALTSTNSHARWVAAGALGSVRAQAEAVVPALLQCLQDKDPLVHLCALDSVGKLARVPSVSVPALIPQLRNPSADIRQGALDALMAFGPAARLAVPDVLKMFGEATGPDLWDEVRVLQQIAPDTLPPLFMKGVEHSNAAVRVEYLSIIGQQTVNWAGDAPSWSDSELLKRAVIQNLQHPDDAVRLEAAYAVRVFGPLDEATGRTAQQIVSARQGHSPIDLVDPWSTYPVAPQHPRAFIVNHCECALGGVVRGPIEQRKIALEFTGHEFAEGGPTILDELAKHKGKGSFFLTGEFLSDPNLKPLVQRIVQEGHYLGPHSDKHLLYCSWEKERTTLVTHDQFIWDLWENVAKARLFGVSRVGTKFFLPAYEHYNQQIVDWTGEMGMTLINYTPGTRSNADYTGEADKNFVSSRAIYDSIVAREQQDTNGLNGFLLLLHIGSGPGRADKFHTRFGELLDYLTGKGYQFVRVNELLYPPATPMLWTPWAPVSPDEKAFVRRYGTRGWSPPQPGGTNRGGSK